MSSTSQLINSILQRSFDDSYPINALKLQKLAYLVSKKYHDTYEYSILQEPFSTWDYGPVLISVYEYYKNLHGDEIRRYMKNSQGTAYAYNPNDYEIQNIIDEVWNDYHDWSNHDLIERTRMPYEEWWNAYQNNQPILKFEKTE